MEENQSLAPIEALNEYYRLKDKYESSYYEDYIKPIIKSKMSYREKRVERSKLPQAKCINCKRNVGTIFSTSQDNNELLRKFIAKCGDLEDPCPLDIQINYSLREPFDIIISNGLNDLEKIKLEIIKEKNNALFFTENNSNIVSVFEKLTEKLKFETENTGAAIETNILKNNNPVKNNLLNRTVDEFGKAFVIPFKQMIQDYMEKNDELILNQAIRFYVEEMLPKLKEIQALKYEVNFVEYNESTGEYILIQRQNSLQSKEFSFESDDKVVKFIRGEYKPKPGQAKPGQSELVIKTKPRKLSSKLELIEATEALEETPIPESEAELLNIPIKFQGTELKETPVIEGDIVSWENPKYNQVWSRLPLKLKNLLLNDHEWLEEFMNKCMNSKNNGKPCKLFLPKETILPPQQLSEDGEYDFGSEVVNRIFNKQNKSHKEILLTLHSDKNGSKDYTLLKNALEDLLEREIG